MGAFDKNKSESPKTEKNKIIACCALGAVLVVMGVMHFAKSGPQTASAAGTDQGGGGNLLPVQETPEQARTALQEDPTAKLLRDTKRVDSTLDETPRNPFVMSDSWRSGLVKTVAAHVQVFTPERVSSVETPILSLNAGDFKLTGVFQQGKGLYAIINGEIVTVGGTIGKGRITEIETDHVALQHVDSPDGPHLVLTIAPKLK